MDQVVTRWLVDPSPPPHGAAAMADACYALIARRQVAGSALLHDAVRKHGGPERSEAALNLRLLGLALSSARAETVGSKWSAHSAELLDLLCRQLPGGDLGVRGGPAGRLGSREGRSANYASYAHLALGACALRQDLYGCAIADAAERVWRADLVLYALCADTTGRVWTPEGRAITDDDTGEGNDPRLTYAVQYLLGMRRTPRLGRSRWWYSARVWYAWEGLRGLLFTRKERAALRAWVLRRKVRPELRAMLADVRLHDEMIVQAGGPGEHVAWCRRLRSELDSKRDVVPVAWPGTLLVQPEHVSVEEPAGMGRWEARRYNGELVAYGKLPGGPRIRFPSLGVPEIAGRLCLGAVADPGRPGPGREPEERPDDYQRELSAILPVLRRGPLPAGGAEDLRLAALGAVEGIVAGAGPELVLMHVRDHCAASLRRRA